MKIKPHTLLLATGASAWPIVPLYHQSETSDSASSALWNSIFNPLDQIFLNMNSLFGFSGPALTENVVDKVVEITPEGYKKVTETIELVDEAGRVEAIETRFTIEYDWDPSSISEEEREALGQEVDLQLGMPEAEADTDTSNDEETEEEAEGAAGLPAAPVDDINQAIDYDLYSVLGAFANGRFDEQLRSSISRFNQLFNLDTYNYIWPEDNISSNEIEEYDTKAEEVANSDDTYDQAHVAGDLDESQEEKDLIVENLMNADLPDWMKEQILGKELMEDVLGGSQDQDEGDDEEDEDEEEEEYEDYETDEEEEEDDDDQDEDEDSVWDEESDDADDEIQEEEEGEDEVDQYLSQLNVWPEWMVREFFGGKK